MRTVLYILSFLLIVIRCTSNGIAGGIETGNGVRIVAMSNELVVKAKPGNTVSIFSRTYNPLFNTGYTQTKIVPEDSTCRFPQLVSGVYNAFVKDSSLNKSVFLDSLHVNNIEQNDYEKKYSTPAAVKGVVVLKDLPYTSPDDFGICIEGSPFRACTHLGREFSIDNVPPGHYDLWLGPCRITTVPDDSAKIKIHVTTTGTRTISINPQFLKSVTITDSNTISSLDTMSVIVP